MNIKLNGNENFGVTWKINDAKKNYSWCYFYALKWFISVLKTVANKNKRKKKTFLLLYFVISIVWKLETKIHQHQNILQSHDVTQKREHEPGEHLVALNKLTQQQLHHWTEKDEIMFLNIFALWFLLRNFAVSKNI